MSDHISPDDWESKITTIYQLHDDKTVTIASPEIVTQILHFCDKLFEAGWNGRDIRHLLITDFKDPFDELIPSLRMKLLMIPPRVTLVQITTGDRLAFVIGLTEDGRKFYATLRLEQDGEWHLKRGIMVDEVPTHKNEFIRARW